MLKHIEITNDQEFIFGLYQIDVQFFSFDFWKLERIELNLFLVNNEKCFPTLNFFDWIFHFFPPTNPSDCSRCCIRLICFWFITKFIYSNVFMSYMHIVWSMANIKNYDEESRRKKNKGKHEISIRFITKSYVTAIWHSNNSSKRITNRFLLNLPELVQIKCETEWIQKYTCSERMKEIKNEWEKNDSS